MFFTRDSKHKIQQDTYIQRARMFGSRKSYLRFFELTIPEPLFADWHRCFVFHKLALAAIRRGLGSPVWLADSRIAPVASGSIDRANVSLDRGEMAFARFEFDPTEWEKRIWPELSGINSAFDRLSRLQSIVGKEGLPQYLLEYLKENCQGRESLVGLHPPADMSGYKDADKIRIERRRNFLGNTQLDRIAGATHHLAIFHNNAGRARVIYKFRGSISFIKNMKHVR